MDTAVMVLLTLLAGWLGLLTVVVLRRVKPVDHPVYRRLPGGRIRFEWSVAQAYELARRAAGPDDSPRR